ncbi:MAG: CaiB/BaiF CoA-transferase family protein [Burkholderiaceae bacterium]
MVMGPTCGLLLADLGAEVIKVEPVGEGDSTRYLTGSGAGYWMTYNRNKKSLAVDLKTKDGMEIVRKLVATADVITENFRPGGLDALGLSYEVAKGLRADIIYCSMKGFLPGPYENRTALDEVVQMMGGLAYMTGPVGHPLRAGASVNDVMGGLFASLAVLAALIERRATGQGQLVQSGLFENNAFLVAQHMMQSLVTGIPAAPMPSRTSAWAIYDIFETLDQSQIFLGVVSDSQWKSFCEVFDLPALGEDLHLAKNNQRVAARERVLPLVRERLRGLSMQDIVDRCEQMRLPFAPIRRPDDLFVDPHLTRSGGFAEVTLPNGQPARVPNLPIAMDGRRFGTRLDVPAVGSHSAALLTELGYSSMEIDRLREANIIAQSDMDPPSPSSLAS